MRVISEPWDKVPYPLYKYSTSCVKPALCSMCANRHISAARANYRKLPLGRLLLMALPGCMPSLEQLGQPGAEIRVLRHQRHSTGI